MSVRLLAQEVPYNLIQMIEITALVWERSVFFLLLLSLSHFQGQSPSYIYIMFMKYC
jgi:hypothetical protein